MNQADFGSNVSQNPPPLPAGEPEQHASSSGTSAFAVLVGMGFLLMAMFFVLSFVAVWKRSEANASPQSPVVPAIAPTVEARPNALAEKWRKGIVNVVRADLSTGVMRAAPDPTAARTTFVPKGTTIDVGKSAMKDRQMWYHVRANVNGTTYEGWMHSDIVIVDQHP